MACRGGTFLQPPVVVTDEDGLYLSAKASTLAALKSQMTASKQSEEVRPREYKKRAAGNA